MKKKLSIAVLAITLASTITFSSCLGSFGLTNKVYSWNQSVGDKWINEIVFLALTILPVYEIAIFVDAVVLNSIEFWTGNNPVAAAGSIKEVEGENGKYTIETLENGYTVTNQEGQEMNLVFDEATSTWSVMDVEGEAVKLLTVENENTAIVYMANGETQTVELSAAGVYAFRQVAGFSNYASK